MSSKRKPADIESDSTPKRPRMRASLQQPQSLFHRLPPNSDDAESDEGGVVCQLVNTHMEVDEPSYEWTCDICQERFSADQYPRRPRCIEHEVDVCPPCMTERDCLRNFEVVVVEAAPDSDCQVDASDVEESNDEASDSEEAESDSEDTRERCKFVEDAAEDSNESNESDEESEEQEDDDFSCAAEASDDAASPSSLSCGSEDEDEESQAHDRSRSTLETNIEQDLIQAQDSKTAPKEETLSELRNLLATGSLCAGHVRPLLRVLQLLRAWQEDGLIAASIIAALVDRISSLSPETRLALHHRAGIEASRRASETSMIEALANDNMSAADFCAGPLLEFRRQFPIVSPQTAERLLHAACCKEMPTLGVEKLHHVYLAYPRSGVESMLKTLPSLQRLRNNACEWDKYDLAIRQLLTSHVTVQHSRALKRACRAACKQSVECPRLREPLYTRLTELEPPGSRAVVELAHMATLMPMDQEALQQRDTEAMERDDAFDESTFDDREFLASPSSSSVSDDQKKLSDLVPHLPSDVREFADCHIRPAFDDPEARLSAATIYDGFAQWFQRVYNAKNTLPQPSQKAFAQEFQKLYPDKDDKRLVYYIGIRMEH